MSEDSQKLIDERLEKAIDSSKYRVTLYNQKENTKLKFKQSLSYSINGGFFVISEQLISFVQTLISRNILDSILIDAHGNPINIENLSVFLDQVMDKYFEATNDYLIEYKKIQSARKIAPMMEW